MKTPNELLHQAHGGAIARRPFEKPHKRWVVDLQIQALEDAILNHELDKDQGETVALAVMESLVWQKQLTTP